MQVRPVSAVFFVMKENYHFDAIVIGSGISGGWAAKELCEKGLKTMVLERGTMVEHIKDYTHATKDPWELPHRNRLTEEEKKIYYVQSRHYSIGEDNKQYYVRDIDHPYEEKQRYDWVRADVFGGRSLLWGRISVRWNDIDFGANLKDGHGVDWPIRYKDIAPWYDYVEKFIGVTGTKEGLEILPDGQFQPAFDMNCAEKEVKQRLEGKYPNMRIIPTRVANLSQRLDGRSACQHRNLCHRGCPFGAYFSTQSSTLPAAAKTGNLTIRTGAVVNKILYDEKTGKASGVEVIDRETLQTYVYTANIIFLNASTLATAYILLNSTSSRFPNGMGNDFDIVGRHLMDHHKGLSITADVEGYEDKYTFGRRPGGIYIPRFKNIHTQEKDFIRGYYYQGNGYRESNSGSDEIGAGLKAAMTEPGKWKLRLSYYGETLPYAENRMTLNTDIKDIFGRPGMTIDCSFKENEKAIFKDAGDTIQQMLNDIGLKNVKVSGKMSAPGNANHEMGTARMGHDEKTSVLNKWNQLHAVKNLFITDGSSMTSSNCINPSLTYMALTARAVDYALREMKKGNI
jgi:choline dehydrogenase-like flavoprotein